MPSGRADTCSSSRALAARYRLRLPCSSRCSVVIRVNTAARNATPSVRCISRRATNVSRATWVQPASRIARKLRLQFGGIGSGLPRRVGGHAVTCPRSTVVIDAAADARGPHACQSSVDAVVFRRSPVIPTTHRAHGRGR